jgi:hypothetical protein
MSSVHLLFQLPKITLLNIKLLSVEYVPYSTFQPIENIFNDCVTQGVKSQNRNRREKRIAVLRLMRRLSKDSCSTPKD